jgi:hypothetical protein
MKTDIPRTNLYWVVAVLAISGLSLAWLRYAYMEIPLKPGRSTTLWLVEARLDFTASQKPILASLSIPTNPPGFNIFSEQAASPGYGFSIVEIKGPAERPPAHRPSITKFRLPPGRTITVRPTICRGL